MPTINSTDLEVNKSIKADASDPILVVSVGAASPLKVGTYTFQLVVADDAGNASTPATLRLSVIDDVRPTAVIDGPLEVGFGRQFALSGRRSTDAGGGSIASYSWTLISAP